MILSLLLFLPLSVVAMSDFSPRINPRWEEVYLYSTDRVTILYDCDTNSVMYEYHLWRPWEMTHSPWCPCHGTDFEIDDEINAMDYEDEGFRYLVEPGLRVPGNPNC